MKHSLNGINKESVVKDDLHSMKIREQNVPFRDKVKQFKKFIHGLERARQISYYRMICSPMDRVVSVSLNGEKPKELIMFGSNNYLGFANDAYIKQKVKKSIDKQGIGVAGPPILNGYTKNHNSLEKRLSDLKGVEDAMIFPSGFQTNLGMVSGLISSDDILFYDQYSHASTNDGLHLAGISANKFKHNDVADLSDLLSHSDSTGQAFIAVEGLYSMDGDISPLDEIVNLAAQKNSICLLDDAHGTGLLGENGKGAMELFSIPKAEIVHMGTFSKSFAVNGGFIAGNKDLIKYLRYHARPYMFSASLSTAIIAAIHAGLDLVESEPWRRIRIQKLKDYAVEKMSGFEFIHKPESAILAIKIPTKVNIRESCLDLHHMGYFVNAVEYPAVPKDQERLRISLMVNHKEDDIDGLIEALETSFNKQLDQCPSN